MSGPANHLRDYEAWLRRQPLARNTQVVYLRAVRQFVEFVLSDLPEYGAAFSDPAGRDFAVRDFKAELKTKRHAGPRRVNLALAAIDHFSRYRGLGPANVRREQLPAEAPKALTRSELRRFLRAAERASVRDRAIVALLVGTAIRVGELEALEIPDVALSARKGIVTVRSGKGDQHREIPVASQARSALDAWMVVRRTMTAACGIDALFLNRRGGRLSARSVERMVGALGEAVGLEVTPHTLRHTLLTNMARDGRDLVLIADIAGHKRLETTRRYTLPTLADRTAAVEAAQVDY